VVHQKKKGNQPRNRQSNEDSNGHKEQKGILKKGKEEDKDVLVASLMSKLAKKLE